MSTTSDDIGVWNDLGTVTPLHQQWVKFPNQAIGANATLRITCISTSWTKVNSWVWLRPRYQTANSNQVGLSIRVYPKQDKQIIEMPIPQDLQERSVYFRDFEVFKNLRWRRYIGYTPDVSWQIKLEELWG